MGAQENLIHFEKMTFTHVTGSKEKRAMLDIFIPNHETQDLDLVEIQAESVEGVAVAKAQDAYQQLKKPIVVQDSCLSIPSLNGFPGVCTKAIMPQIGTEGILKLLEGKEDRSCSWDACLVYQDELGIKVFHDSCKGKLLEEIPEYLKEKISTYSRWGKCGQTSHALFVPVEKDKPLMAMDYDEVTEWRKARDSVYKRFAAWYKSEKFQTDREESRAKRRKVEEGA